MKLLGLLASLLFAVSARAADAPPACVSLAGLSMGGLSLADTRATVIAKLGKPKSTGTYQGEDDGGSYTGEVLVYPQMEVNVNEVRGIERIASTGSNIRLPFGLKTGMSLEQSGEILHFIPVALDHDAIVLPACRVGEDVEELHLVYAQNGLKSVELVHYGP
jgi:hypothetical protein